MSDLVGNPEDRFSRVTAHMVKLGCQRYSQVYMYIFLFFAQEGHYLYLIGFTADHCLNSQCFMPKFKIIVGLVLQKLQGFFFYHIRTINALSHKAST